MSWKMQNLGGRIGHGALAVSDGEPRLHQRPDSSIDSTEYLHTRPELNMIASEGCGSSHSLDSNPCSLGCQHGSPDSTVGKVASWAVSFERLLKDPTGVRYFTAFLKSEVSDENILFWQACENFQQIQPHQEEQLTREARSIFDSYLSNCAFSAVNIDETARITESDLQTPRPDMFHKAQQQIFKLMKFDSYTRFIRSHLFQRCVLAEVEGRPLPGLGPGLRNIGAMQNTVSDCRFDSESQKNKPWPGKYSRLEVEAERRRAGQESRAVWDRGDQQRGSWAAKMSEHSTVSRSQWENSSSTAIQIGRLGPGDSAQGHSAVRQTEKYCCVYFPDGTASLAPVHPGATIREMLARLCEKRGFALCDITIYLQGKDKQPLNLDQDCSVLREQQVILEVRITFIVEVAFTGSRVKIVAKSCKSLREALSTVLLKHGLCAQDAALTVRGSTEPLRMDMPVFSLANKTLLLDRVKGKSHVGHVSQVLGQGIAYQRRGAVTSEMVDGLPPSTHQIRHHARGRNTAARKTYDMDGFATLLSRVQWCSADDQRGLLTKDHLVMPSFLEVQPEVAKEEEEGGKEQGENRGNEEPTTAPAPPTQSEQEREVGVAASGRTDMDAQSHSPLPRPDGSFFCAEFSRETVV